MTGTPETLEKQALRGRVFTLGTQAVKFAINFGSMAILARLLTPGDFGLLAMVAIVTGFFDAFKDFGLSVATIQKQEISHAQISNVFWLNVVTSIVLGATLIAIAPLISGFYHEPRLTLVTAALSIPVVIQGLAIQHQAILKRRLKFDVLGKIDIASITAGVLSGIIGAWAGMSYWSLVLMRVVQPLTTAVLSWVACRWVPGLPSKNAGTREMLRFGGSLAGFNLLNYVSKYFDTMLVGKLAGPISAGLYSRAYQLLFLPISQINAPFGAVAIPVLSRLRADPQRYKDFFLETIASLTCLTIPIVVYLLVEAQSVVRVVLGPQWTGAADLFIILGLAGLFQPISSAAGWAMITRGETGRMFRWRLVTCWFGPAFTLAGALTYGVKGIAYAKLICSAALFVPCLFYATRGTLITVPALLKTLLHPAVSAVVSGAAIAMLPEARSPLFLTFPIFALLYLGSLCALARSFKPLYSIRHFLSLARRSKKPKTPNDRNGTFRDFDAEPVLAAVSPSSPASR